MKKLFIILAILFMVSSMSAKGIKKPFVEIAPRTSLYIDGETTFGLGCDLIFNPRRNIGLRIGLAELQFNGGTHFNLNQGALNALPKIDVLIYMPMRRVQAYIHAGFGLTTVEGFTVLAIGGGMGFDFSMAKGTRLFLEPGIYILNTSNGASNTDVMFRLSAGAKFGIF
jgi:hypothetical protein